MCSRKPVFFTRRSSCTYVRPDNVVSKAKSFPAEVDSTMRSSTSRLPFVAAVEREGFRSLFGVPLCHGSELLGCVNLYYDEVPDLSEQDWEIARRKIILDQSVLLTKNLTFFF